MDSNKPRKELLKKAGIIVKQKLTSKEIELKINKWIQDTLKNPLSKKEIYTFTGIEKRIGLSSKVIISNIGYKRKILESGIKIKNHTLDMLLNENKFEKEINSWITNILKDSIEREKEFTFSGIEKIIQINSGSITRNPNAQKLILDAGIKIKKAKKTEEENDKALNIWIENTLKDTLAIKKEYSYKDIERLAKTGETAISSSAKRKQLLLDSGIKIKHLEKDQIDIKINKWIKETLNNSSLKNKEYSFTEIAKLININSSSILSSDNRKNLIINSGIKIKQGVLPKEVNTYLTGWIDKVQRDNTLKDKEFSINNILNDSNINIDDPKILKAIKEKLRYAGIKVQRIRYSKNKVDQDLNTWISQTLNNPIAKEKEYTIKEISIILNVNTATISKKSGRKQRIIDAGIKLKKRQNTKEENDTLLDNWITKTLNNEEDKQIEYTFPEIAKLANISNNSLCLSQTRKQKILDTGIKVKTVTPSDVIESRIINWLKSIKNDKKAMNKEYTLQEISKYIEVNASTLTSRYKYKLYNSGIKIKEVKTENDINKALDIFINETISDPIKRIKTYTFQDISDQLGIGRSTITDKPERKQKILNSGIKIASESKKIAKNILYIIERCKIENIKFSSISALVEYSNEVINIPIANQIDNIIKLDIFTNNVIINIEMNEKKKLIEEILVETMIDEINDITIEEIKIRLLISKKIYIDKETIINLLQMKKFNTESMINDSILKRFRLSQLYIDERIIQVEYWDDLPKINTTQNACIIISKKIKNTNSFIHLWKEFINYIGEQHFENKINILLSKTYFNIFKKLSYEGIVAIAYIPVLNQDNIELKLLRTCAIGFLFWLLMKKLAILHPKYVIIQKNEILINLLQDIISSHKFNSIYHEALNNKALNSNTKKKLTKKGIIAQIISTCSALEPNIDAMILKREDFESFFQTSRHYGNINKMISYANFLENIFIFYGNKNAIMPKDVESIDEYFLKIFNNEYFSQSFQNLYSDLIDNALKIIQRRVSNELISNDYAKNSIQRYIKLFKFLELFQKRLSREEIINVLNPDIASEYDFKQWYIKHYSLESYIAAGSSLYLLFDKTMIEEYKRAYLIEWHSISRKHKTRKLIRRGMEAPIYKTLQDVAFNTPVNSKMYPFYKNSINGEIIDTSWWKFNTSPIPAIAIWLCTKIPRRGLHILSLDVNTFMQYDEHGDFIGLYFNTDKNREISDYDRDIIPVDFVNKLFTPNEFKILENYVDYIKKAFSFMPNVEYKSGAGYELIKPLFPNKDATGILPKTHLDAYYNKTLLVTQYVVRNLALSGKFDMYYNEYERDNKIKSLSECQLLFNKEKGRYLKIPVDINEFNKVDYDDLRYNEHFTSIDGIHNLRHAGATYLLTTIGMDLEEISIVTGHIDERVLVSVYLKLGTKEFMRHIKTLMPSLNFYNDELSNLSPIKTSENFIDNVILPLTENDNAEEVLKQLVENNFQTIGAYIISHDKELYGEKGEIFVNNGLEIASRYYPIGCWEGENYGICTMKGRCPEGTAGICSKCPHLMFSPAHIEGIIFKCNETSMEMNQLQRKFKNAHINGTNTERKKLKELYEKKFEENIVWMTILVKCATQFTNSFPDNKKQLTNNKQSQIAEFRSCNIVELQLDVITKARKLNIDNITVDNAITRISFEMLKNALKRNDIKTIEKVNEDGINWYIELYGNTTINKKKELISKYLFNLDYSEETSKLLDNKKKIS